MNNIEVVIASAVRTPFGRFDGIMRGIPSIDLGAMVLKEASERIDLNPSDVDEIYYGTCVPAEYAPYLNVPARQATLKAGFPPENNSITIDRACCSSMSALRLGFRAIRSGEADIVIAAGSENMGNTCHLLEPEYSRWGGNRLGDITLKDVLFELGYEKGGFNPVAFDSGNVALEYGVSREDQDRWALQSQERWKQAFVSGKFKTGGEIMPVKIIDGKNREFLMEKDENPRDTSMEKLGRLNTIYGSPTVTPGNAPGMNAGAAALVIMNKKKAIDMGIAPMATISGCECAAGEPEYMAALPASAIKKLLSRQKRQLDDIDLIEINEAFAAVLLVSLKILADMDEDKISLLMKKTNVNGGAIAIGHPVGASGARITMTLMYELIRSGGGMGVAAICGGLGQGEAIMLSV